MRMTASSVGLVPKCIIHHCPREKGHESLRSSVGTGEIQAVQSQSKVITLPDGLSAAPSTSSDVNVFSSLNLGKALKRVSET